MREHRIALIAVHGVADQSPGDTARAVVDLLVASAPEGVRYTAQDSETLTLPVEPLRQPHSPPARTDATPRGEDRPWVKSLLQSGRSDFQRRFWKAPGATSDAWAERRAERDDSGMDRGIALTDYLLAKHRDNGAHREAYETTRIGLERTESGHPLRVDVFEMYWADLSRLSGALPRIVSELFTMVFRLAKLGRDTVDEAYGTLRQQRGGGVKAGFYRVGWRLTLGLQIVLDWLLVNGLALLVLQLALLALLLAGLSMLSGVDAAMRPHLHRAVSAALAIAGLLMLAYRHRDRLPGTRGWPAGLVGAGLSLLWFDESVGAGVSAFALMGLLFAINDAGLRVAEDRFPFVRTMGRWMWLAFVLLVVASAGHQFAAQPGPGAADLSVWERAVLFATEVVLLGVKGLWILIGALLAAWMLVGWLVSFERGYESRASVATGRLGLCLSIGAFLTMVMAAWAILSQVFAGAVGPLQYSSCLFVTPPAVKAPAAPLCQKACTPVLTVAAPAPASAAPALAPSACLWTSSEVAASGIPGGTASNYLEDRYKKTTTAFALLAAVLLLLLTFIVSMFVPSVLAEMNILVQRTRQAFQEALLRRGRSRARREARLDREQAAVEAMRTRRLGQWLTSGYRSLDGVVLLVFACGVLLAAAVALEFAGLSDFSTYYAALTELSQRLLGPMVLSTAGVAAAFIAFGGLLSKYLPAMRGPLDVALDVDNHFREFPRTGIPRARIFSRYAALLAHISRGGYDRVVIVAHSQGTVISAELLRFLSSPDGRSPGDRPRLGGRGLPPIHLLTLGCPLRQLYAARFPSLYRWVIRRRQGISGPQAGDIGVERWFNAFCSGDYVGRWLWSDHDASDTDVLGHPMVDVVQPTLFGRDDAYAAFDPMPPELALLRSRREVEVCLGLGAHTHYFEREQRTVAWLVDHLVKH